MIWLPTFPFYLEIAFGELGVAEIPGPEHNPRILEYLETTTNIGARARSRDETPNCSAFVNWCVTKAGIEGTDNALARSWLRWGKPIGQCAEQVGPIGVIKRKRRGADARTGSRGGYHVGFVLEITPRLVRILGANQKNRVGVDNYRRSRYDLLALRVPS